MAHQHRKVWKVVSQKLLSGKQTHHKAIFFFFKKSIIPLLVFILPLTDLLTLSNSFFVITCLLNNSSYLAIWVLDSSWMPLAILQLP